MKFQTVNSLVNPIPASAGIGLRFPHLTDFEHTRPSLSWVELHTENLFGLSSSLRERLSLLRSEYEFSLHGVGLSLGSADGLDGRHLERVAREVNYYQPMLVSEHLSWSRAGGVSLPDLLPLPMTKEALKVVAENVEKFQEALGRPVAIENGSAYARWQSNEMPEWAFLKELVSITGCKLLVDLNNLHVNSLNLGEDPLEFLVNIPQQAVAEMHLAGPSEAPGGWIDTHATPVPEQVWSLFERALDYFGAIPTLVEWDQDLPPLLELVAQAERANRLIAERGERPCQTI